MQMTKGNIMAEWVDLGEGLNGDYNSEDPDDIELLRFDMSYLDNQGGWVEIPDSSYCTLVPVNADLDTRVQALRFILEEYHNAYSGNYTSGSFSCRRLGERLSRIAY